MARPKGSTTRGETQQIAMRVSVDVYTAAQELAQERGLSLTMLVESILRAEAQRAGKLQQKTEGGGMWRILVTDASGNFLEKTPLSGPEQAIKAWEAAWENPEYVGKVLVLRLLEHNTEKLRHRFDYTPNLFGWLPKDAVRTFFEGA